MGCGAPVSSGFFCQKCIETGAEATPAEQELWKGRVFTEDRRRLRERAMFRDELAMWGKRLSLGLIILLAGFGGWHMFGDRIQSEFRDAASVVKPHDRTDPTAPPQQLDAQGNPVINSAHFTHKYDR